MIAAIYSKLLNLIISGTQVGTDQAVTFSNSAVANTQVNVDIAKPVNVKQRYMVSVYNPSTVTDLTVKLFAVGLTFGGATRYVYIDTISVPKSSTQTGTTINSIAKLVEGLFVGCDLRMVVSNDTVLGGADGFSAYIRVREV